MDWVEGGDHLALSRLTERGRPLLINDIRGKSPKAEIKYFCLNVTFVSFAAVEKGICQNPAALRKVDFLREQWGVRLTFTLMPFYVPILHPRSTSHLFTCSTDSEYWFVHLKNLTPPRSLAFSNQGSRLWHWRNWKKPLLSIGTAGEKSETHFWEAFGTLAVDTDVNVREGSTI